MESSDGSDFSVQGVVPKEILEDNIIQATNCQPRPASLSAAEESSPRIVALRAALSGKSLPCATGTLQVTCKDLILYYGKGGQNDISRRIDFASSSEDSLTHLAGMCDAATFGFDNEDVLDETYRKAGKLDDEFFLIGFDPERSGLMDSIRDIFLEGHARDCRIRVERYKLNVYGPGSFFKAHKDTPRNPAMFGSLVVVLPTTHSGGELIFRHIDVNFTFDSAAAVSISTPSSPCVAFAAFYSDVEHTIAPVQSGYRVTVTYHLYFDKMQSLVRSLNISTEAHERALEAAFRDLLVDSTFLGKGGLLGFGMKHEYPIKIDHGSRQRFAPLAYLENCLKGSDAVLMKVCKRLNLAVSLNMVYDEDDDECVYPLLVLCPGVLTKHGPWHTATWYYLREQGAKLLTPVVYWNENDEEVVHTPADLDIVWASAPCPVGMTQLERTHIFYGNEPSLGYLYGNICMSVEIPAAGTMREQALAT